MRYLLQQVVDDLLRALLGERFAQDLHDTAVWVHIAGLVADFDFAPGLFLYEVFLT